MNEETPRAYIYEFSDDGPIIDIRKKEEIEEIYEVTVEVVHEIPLNERQHGFLASILLLDETMGQSEIAHLLNSIFLAGKKSATKG